MSSRKVAGRALCASLPLSWMLLNASVASAVPLLTGFGGPTGYGLPQNCLHPNDDGSYAGPPPTAGFPAVPVDITRAFPSGLNFFGNTYRAMYVNTNGNITFRGALAQFTPAPFPVAMQPMIAPWWGDVDTRGGGQPSRNNICFYVEPNRVVVTWNNVGYYSSHDDRQNDFQLIMTTSNTCATTGDFDVEFRYNRCQWTTGDASGGTGGLGGTPAQVGFDAGDLRNYVALPMSRSMAILDVCRNTNVPGGAPGLWRFQIRGGVLERGCAGGGTACTVAGQQGACANGVNICAGTGTACRQVNMPRDERCNGFDDDCDGAIDDGDGLCPTNYVCERGSCVERCSEELGCGSGRSCLRGICLEDACRDRTCPAGQRCTGGNCVDPCSGVACPVGQICRVGRCVDPCAGVTCNPMEVCNPASGLCVPGCQCTPCPAGQSCQPDGYCTTDDCAGITCPTGMYCRGGQCRDRCETGPDTRLCPSGEVCRVGECIAGAVSTPDAGATRDASADATAPTADAPTADVSRADVPRDARDAASADIANPDGAATVLPGTRTGCQCAAGEGRDAGASRLGALALGLAVVVRRRRAKR